MKNLKENLFFVILVIYEELIFSLVIFKVFPTNIWLIALFSIPIGLVLSSLTTIFKRKVNIILSYLFTVLIFLTFSAQIVYYRMYESIISFYSFVNGGQVTEFMDVIIDMTIQNWYGILLFLMPIPILVILQKKKVLAFEKKDWKSQICILVVAIIFQILSIACINFAKTDDIYSNKNLYYNVHVPKLTANRMGLITTMRLDLQRFIFGFNDNLDVEETSAQIEKETEYNAININFEELIKNDENKVIKSIDEYISEQEPSNKNEYTGMFQNKNLIVLVAESFSNIAIDKELTPNLYKLYNEGFQFDNFYTPVFPVSTADGEYITDTSLIPKEGEWSIYRVNGNYMPYSYANVFKKLGYSANAYHNHTATYYHRDKYIQTMGYDSYLAVGNGLEDRMDCSFWPNSDYEMIKSTMDDYINNDKFLAYYMTVSGHLNYTTNGNCMASKNWEQVKNIPYSDKVKCYLACNIELDKAVGEILRKLEESGKLEDTVIVISGDHYPYGLTLDEINEISTYERDNIFEKYNMPLLIWSNSMEEPIKINKIGSSLDVLPTVLNLFGIEFDSRLLMGRDILSNSKPLVIFSDRSFITDRGKYNAITETFTPFNDQEVSENYVEEINKIIYQKYQFSRLILENDYYRSLFDRINN